jgi:hypothetical protein
MTGILLASLYSTVLQLKMFCCVDAQYDEGRVDMNGSVTSKSLSSFLDLHRLPLVAPYDSHHGYEIYRESLYKGYLMVFVNKSSADFSLRLNEMFPVAHLYRGQVSTTFSEFRCGNYHLLFGGYLASLTFFVRFVKLIVITHAYG